VFDAGPDPLAPRKSVPKPAAEKTPKPPKPAPPPTTGDLFD
jgi:hypothetical protein